MSSIHKQETKPRETISYREQIKPAIVFLSISLALLLTFIGLFAWHTAKMRDFELNYVITEATIVDVKYQPSAGNGYYYLVISYTYGGKEYKFKSARGELIINESVIGATTEIYVNPNNPAQAEKVTSADYVSIMCACFHAFLCVTYATGMNILLSVKGTSFKKRLAFTWGIEILLCVAVLLLFWLGLPNSGFDEVFIRIRGAIGVTVMLGLVTCATLIDGIVSHKLHSMGL